jgi:hypothetical protein
LYSSDDSLSDDSGASDSDDNCVDDCAVADTLSAVGTDEELENQDIYQDSSISLDCGDMDSYTGQPEVFSYINGPQNFAAKVVDNVAICLIFLVET